MIKQFIRGNIVRHYKNKKLYVIKEISRSTDNPKQLLVTYKALYTDPKYGYGQCWTRTLKEFTDNNKYTNNQPRLTKVL